MKIKAILTGSTGMVGKGVLFECLESPDVDSVLVVNRSAIGIQHAKLKEVIHSYFFNLSPIKDKLDGYHACFFCLGCSTVGISKDEYHKITYDLTMNFANTLAKINSEMTFCYVTGAGTDSTEKSKMTWANVKGKTENAVLALPFTAKYMFRPGFIQAMKGIKSKTKLYNVIYTTLKPLYPIFKILFPKYITSTTQIGKAMIRVVIDGYEKKHLENRDINTLAAR